MWTQAANVEKLDFGALVGFMGEQLDCLPPLVEHWAKLAAGSCAD